MLLESVCNKIENRLDVKVVTGRYRANCANCANCANSIRMKITHSLIFVFCLFYH